ncbi:MAG: diguanylate cyclase domain-containing protein [Burkholderiaceae bacterium]
MKKEFLIDHSRPSTRKPTDMQRLGEQSHKVIAAAVAPRTRTDRAPPTVAELDRALEVSRERLRAALCRIDALETNGLLLRHQVALLQRTVTRARRFAYHDELTGLPNRRLLLDRYSQAVALAARQHRLVALLFLDLDRFKNVNDTHGHAAGDRILQQVAVRLHASIRASDTACRYGGDEFVVLLPELEGRRSALATARKIRTRLAAPYVVDGSEITVTASIGTAVYPVDGNEYGELMRVADESMYRDKAESWRQHGGEAAAPIETRTPVMRAGQTRR